MLSRVVVIQNLAPVVRRLMAEQSSRPVAYPLRSSRHRVYDDHHMSAATSRRPAPSRKEATHERIVETAARAIRRSGYGGAGVAEIMKEAGLTHGGFYAHFDSREGMLAEAADRAGADSMAVLARVAAAAPPKKALEAHAPRLSLEGACGRRRDAAAPSPRSARRCRASRPRCGGPPPAGSRR